MHTTPELWAGNQESLDLYLKAADVALAAKASSRSADEDGLPPLWEEQDGVAVMNIRGSLISGGAGWMRYFGVVGYDDIQQALAEASQSRSAKSVLLLIASGGGAVQGCDECSEFVADVSRIKPVVTYAAGDMQSAAYWLGSAGSRVFASRTSMVGSIGVYAVAVDRSKMLEKEGITAKVVRSGKWKGLGTGLEPMTDAYLESLQAQVNQLSEIFEERVAANRGVDRKTVNAKMGQGRQFLGADAVSVGLVDALASSREAFEVAQILGRN